MNIRIMCSKCGKQAKTTTTQYGPRNSCCDLWSWGVAPLVNAETHEARKAAHESFDEWWKSGTMSRKVAYARLCDKLGIPQRQCHMKEMDYEMAMRVVEICA